MKKAARAGKIATSQIVLLIGFLKEVGMFLYLKQRDIAIQESGPIIDRTKLA